MKKTEYTCDLCSEIWINNPTPRITLTLYDDTQISKLTIPNEKYEDVCFTCFAELRKVIENTIEKLQNK